MLQRFFSSLVAAAVSGRRCSVPTAAVASVRLPLERQPGYKLRSEAAVTLTSCREILRPYTSARWIAHALSLVTPVTATCAAFSTDAAPFDVKRRTVRPSRGQIVTLTQNAIGRLRQICDDPSKIVKLFFVVKGCNGFSYEMQIVEQASLDSMDEVVRDEAGTPVLAIENKASFHLLGCHIDYQVSQLEEGFTFDNPNVTSKCGCGQSFQF